MALGKVNFFDFLIVFLIFFFRKLSEQAEMKSLIETANSSFLL